MTKRATSKKDQAKELLSGKRDLFCCPLCSSSMHINDNYSLVCTSNHSFDLAKKGYLNLLTTSSNVPVYSQELFTARKEICQAGFYDPLIKQIAKIISKHQNDLEQPQFNILDAGCGEGSHLFQLYTVLAQDTQNTYVGIDIAKEGVNLATANHGELVWCVADLAKLPFTSHSFTVILNILSPANYGEFDRVLAKDGIIIKVVPGANYLHELRAAVYGDSEAAEYSNNQVVELFEEHLELIDKKIVHYQFAFDNDLLESLITMTPLTSGKDSEQLKLLEQLELSSVTIDLNILVGQKRI